MLAKCFLLNKKPSPTELVLVKSYILKEMIPLGLKHYPVNVRYTHTHTHTHLTFILRQDTLFRSGDIADSRTRAQILSQILEIAGSHWLLAPCPELAIRMQSTALCACWSWWLFIERALDHVVMHVCSVVIETGAGGWSAPVPARALRWLISWQSVTEYILTGS